MQLPGLRRARELAGLTQAELANKLGTSQDVVSKWETGRRGARPANAKRIADELGVSVQELAEPSAAETWHRLLADSLVAEPNPSRLTDAGRRLLLRLVQAKEDPTIQWDTHDLQAVRNELVRLGVPDSTFLTWFEQATPEDVETQQVESRPEGDTVQDALRRLLRT